MQLFLRYSKGAIGTMAGFAATGFGVLGAGSGLAAGAAGVSGTDPVTSPDSPRRARGIGGCAATRFAGEVVA